VKGIVDGFGSVFKVQGTSDMFLRLLTIQ